MSEEFGAEPSAPEAPAAPADGGQAAEAPAEAVAPATDSGPSLTFEVDGQQHTVSQADAAQHFLRQQDYTRKTQALAQQREALTEAEALRAALEANPYETVQALSEAYGLGINVAQGQPEAQYQEPLDPEEARFQRIEGQLSEWEQAQQYNAVEQELSAIESQYGAENVDRNLLLAHAIERGIPNLEAAFRDMIFDHVVEQRAQEQRQADAAIQQSKQDQAFVEGGHSPAAGAIVPGAAAPVNSIRAAYDMAKRTHGIG